MVRESSEFGGRGGVKDRHGTDALATDPLTGTELGDYAIQDRLGAGGMGVVYRAENLALRRLVALKVLPTHLLDDATARYRFQREIQTAVALEHPNIVPVYDAGYESGLFYIAMRLIDGPNLANVIAGRPLDLPRAVRLFQGIASGLAYVHRQGHVHRDIKPHNILVADAGTPEEYALLTDFGITRALDSSTGLTRGLIGTAAYMAPEILQWKPAVPASDQYSLACVLYEMLTGRIPYHDKELPAAHLREPVPSVRELAPHISQSLSAVVERGLAKEPDHRHSSIRAFAEAVAAHSGGTRGESETAERSSPKPALPAPEHPQPRQAVPPPAPMPPAPAYVEVPQAIPPPDVAYEWAKPQGGFSTASRVGWLLRWGARSLWGIWAAIPVLNGGAWVHAAVLTRSRRDLLFAILYNVPLAAAVTESAITGAEQTSDPMTAVLIISWLIGIVHAILERRRVRRDVVARRGRLGPMPRGG